MVIKRPLTPILVTPVYILYLTIGKISKIYRNID